MYINGHDNKADVIQNVIENIDDGLLANAKDMLNQLKEAMSDKENRVQRAKDMIKYYDAQKKAALKGKNKDLAKKMLKNEKK